MKKSITFQDKSKGFGKDKVSTFWLTLNSNSQDLVSEALMKQAATEFFDQIELFFRFLNRDLEKNNVSYVDGISIQSAIETGTKEKRVHLHALIKVEHKTKLQLDLRKIVAFFKKGLRLPNVYCHVEFVQDESISLTKYMQK